MDGFSQHVLAVILTMFFAQAFDSMKCGASFLAIPRFKTEYACEDSTTEIFCSAESIIKVLRAQYGRQLKDSALCQEENKTIKECGLSDVTSVVKPTCDGVQRCSITINNNVLGDMCPGVYKYFTLMYQCEIKPTTTEPPLVSTIPGSANTTTTQENPASEKGPNAVVPPKAKKDPNDPSVYDREMFDPGNGGTSLSRGQDMTYKIGLTVIGSILVNVFALRKT